MAYSFTEVSRVTKRVGGRLTHTITMQELEAGNADEMEIVGLPKKGRIVSYRTTLTAGTGVTVNPSVGNATGFADSTQEHVGTNTTTAIHINDQVALGYSSPNGKLYIRSQVNAGTDNTIDTEIEIVEGGQA